MRLSARGQEALKESEGLRLQVYTCPAGFQTIGWGHKLTVSERCSGKIVLPGVVIRYAQGITEHQAQGILEWDILEAEQEVDDLVNVSLTQGQYDVLVDFVFNFGAQALGTSTLLDLLNQGRYDEVPDQLRRWVHADGKVVEGLVARRDREVEAWLT